MKNVSSTIWCVLVSILFFPIFAVYGSDSSKVGIGKQIPNFVLEDLDGVLIGHQVGFYYEENLRLLRDKITNIFEKE